MRTLIIPSVLEETIRKEEALLVYSQRNKQSTWAEATSDWLTATTGMDKYFAQSIVDISKDDNAGITISENIAQYLEDISVEGYKSHLACLNWKNDGAPIDDDQNRIKRNWYAASDFIRRYADQRVTSSDRCNDSVKSHIRKCSQHKLDLVNKKAYWLSLANPAQNPLLNFEKANTFVNAFYNPDVILPAMDGNTQCVDKIKKLVLNNQDIASMMEFEILRIKDVTPVTLH